MHGCLNIARETDDTIRFRGDRGRRSVAGDLIGFLLLFFGLSAQGPGPDAQHVVHDGPGHHRLGYALGEFNAFYL